ncbi:MAG: Yip1 family protein [Pyrinomonadaceae bacterium]
MSENEEINNIPASAPEKPAETAEMSEIATVTGVFFEPGRVFEDLRRKPRFIIGAVIIALFVTAYGFGLYYKVGDTGMRRFIAEQIDKNPQTSGMSAEQKSSAIDLQMTIQSVIRYALPVVIAISLVIGGLFYFLGSKAFGGNGNFMHALSVWIYSSIPPTVIGTIGSLIVMAIKSADEIDIAASQRGLIQANPSMLIDGKAMPIVATLLATLDLFMIWGWVLAAIGLRITNRLSTGSAWAVVIIIGLIGVLMRIVGAIFSGNPS